MFVKTKMLTINLHRTPDIHKRVYIYVCVCVLLLYYNSHTDIILREGSLAISYCSTCIVLLNNIYCPLVLRHFPYTAGRDPDT